MKCEYCRKEAYAAHVCPHCGGHYCLEHSDPTRHDCSLRIRPNTHEPRSQHRLNSEVPVKKKPGRLVIHFTFLENKNSKSKQERARTIEQDPQPQRKKPEKPPNHTVFDTKLAEQQLPKRAAAEPFNSSSLVDEFPKKTLTCPTVFDRPRKKFFAAAFTLVLAEEILRLVSYATRPPFSAYFDGNICVKILNQTVTPYVASMIVFVLVCMLLFVTTKLASSSQRTGNLQIRLFKGAIPIGIFTVISTTYIFSIINWILILTF